MPVDDLRSGTWVTYIGGRASSARLRRCRVEVTQGPDAGLIRDIEASVIRIGARRGNDVQLTDSKVSGLHCEIRLDDRGYRLRDLDSTNGTYVSQLRINDVYISPGALIALGSTRMKFEPLGDSVEIELSDSDRFGSMIGRSVKMREMFARLEKLARSDTTVLVTGETGVGKELVAEALHDHSPREKGPFVVLDCGSIPPNLIESELFGHERGAFTGATNSYAGAFERAHGGTVFLDEIGELPAADQAALLGVLERRRFRRVGGTAELELGARVIAATNRDLRAEVNNNRFRHDLYHRLAVVVLWLPPLRERREDILPIVEHFARELGAQGSLESLFGNDLARWQRHPWPGNVRELRNAVEAALVVGPGAALDPAPGPGPSASTGGVLVPYKDARATLLRDFEHGYLKQLMTDAGGNVSQAARIAKMDRSHLIDLLHRHGLKD
ncbi:MAG TPA: sigma 54-interacting transcriptional regulator [Kofleriaceae bacterium]